MGSRSYYDLHVWQKSIDLCTYVYQLCANFPRSELYGLADQMKRAAVSVPSNIAEGQARESVKDFRRFIAIANGSLAELDTQRIIAHNLHFLTAENSTMLKHRITEVRKMLYGLRESLQ